MASLERMRGKYNIIVISDSDIKYSASLLGIIRGNIDTRSYCILPLYTRVISENITLLHFDHTLFTHEIIFNFAISNFKFQIALNDVEHCCRISGDHPAGT